jgi:hypothetical protein
MKVTMKILVAALLLLGVPAVSAAEKPPIDGWRYPTEADYTGDWGEAFKKHVPVPVHVQADFNGDGIIDDAWILIRTKNKGWGLFVFMGQPISSKRVIQLDDNPSNDYPQRMGIALAKPGKYKTACGKGYFECEKGEPEVLNLTFPGIDYFAYESANSFFFWDKKNKAFKRIWMSD